MELEKYRESLGFCEEEIDEIMIYAGKDIDVAGIKNKVDTALVFAAYLMMLVECEKTAEQYCCRYDSGRCGTQAPRHRMQFPGCAQSFHSFIQPRRWFDS